MPKKESERFGRISTWVSTRPGRVKARSTLIRSDNAATSRWPAPSLKTDHTFQIPEKRFTPFPFPPRRGEATALRAPGRDIKADTIPNYATRKRRRDCETGWVEACLRNQKMDLFQMWKHTPTRGARSILSNRHVWLVRTPGRKMGPDSVRNRSQVGTFQWPTALRWTGCLLWRHRETSGESNPFRAALTDVRTEIVLLTGPGG